ncbi:MAG: hypothetical protein NC355_09815 [Blautia sp.]|nr:hypothetical protein [Blautia sp.]
MRICWKNIPKRKRTVTENGAQQTLTGRRKESTNEPGIGHTISYLQGAAVPDETPNAETLEAFAELENGGGHRFSGTTEQLFAELMEN